MEEEEPTPIIEDNEYDTKTNFYLIHNLHSSSVIQSVDWRSSSSSLNSLLATSSSDGHVKLWRMDWKESQTEEKKLLPEFELCADLYKRTSPINCVKFSANGDYLACADDEGFIYIWQEDQSGTWKTKNTLRYEEASILSLVWACQETKIVASTTDGKIFIWHIANENKTEDNEYCRSESVHNAPISHLIINPSNTNQFVSLSCDQSVKLFTPNIKTNKLKMVKKWARIEKSLTGTKKSYAMFEDDGVSIFKKGDQSTDGNFLILPSGRFLEKSSEEEQEEEEVLTGSWMLDFSDETLEQFWFIPSDSSSQCCAIFNGQVRAKTTPAHPPNPDSPVGVEDDNELFPTPPYFLYLVITQEDLMIYDTNREIPRLISPQLFNNQFVVDVAFFELNGRPTIVASLVSGDLFIMTFEFDENETICT